MNAEMMIHDIDDERTMEEEEELMESGEDFSNEVDNLQKEGDMPIEDLLALYGYGGDGEQNEVPLDEIRPEPLHPFPPEKVATMPEIGKIEREEDTQSMSSEGSFSRASTAQSTNSRDENGYDPFQNQRITRGIASLHAHYFENDDTSDDDYQPLADEWRKDVAVGPDFQASVPEFMQAYKDGEKVYESEDKLLWKPDVIDTKQLRKYLGVIFSSPNRETGTTYRDDEQALYLLLKCGNADEALRKKGEQLKLQTDATLWSEEECRNFELGLRMYGKDFRQIQRSKISHRSVGDIVQFYYLWKKTERFDAFCSQTRFGKKKYGAPGIADYMDRFMDEAESLVSSRSASPYSQSAMGNSSPAEVSVERPSQPVSSARPSAQANIIQDTALPRNGEQQQKSPDLAASLGFQCTFPVVTSTAQHDEQQNCSSTAPVSVAFTSAPLLVAPPHTKQIIGTFVPQTVSHMKPALHQQTEMLHSVTSMRGKVSTTTTGQFSPASSSSTLNTTTYDAAPRFNNINNHFSAAQQPTLIHHPAHHHHNHHSTSDPDTLTSANSSLMMRGAWNHHDAKQLGQHDLARHPHIHHPNAFVTSNQSVYKLNQTNAVTFGSAAVFTATSISQPVE
eukprot:gene8106-8974_t